MTRIQRSIVYVFANCHTSFRGEKRLQWYSPLFNLLSGFSNQNPSWSQFFPILLVCFSLGGKFIFIDNCFEINETDHILNCGQRYESEHNPHSWMKNLSSWKRAWKILVWLGIEPWPLRWPDSTHNDLSPVGLVSSTDNNFLFNFKTQISKYIQMYYREKNNTINNNNNE